MASKIYQQIFERYVTRFVGLYSEDSTVIFKDEKNKLIHPGEFGKYREESCKELLRLILGKEANVSDGFVITSGDQITTQCDIIVYNSNVSPFIADGIAKMFPAEEIRMIGEIKSTLSRQEFIYTLRKMAENKKKIIEGRNGTGIYQSEGEAETYDTIVSFLICNKLDFVFEKLRYEEIYSGIDRRYWHNSILSIEDATLTYSLSFSKFTENIKKEFHKKKINIDTVTSWQYPIFLCKDELYPVTQNYVHIREEDKLAHIKRFFVDLSVCNKEVWIYSYDPVTYLGMEVKEMFLDKN